MRRNNCRILCVEVSSMPIATLRRVSSVWIVLGFALAAGLRFANAAPFRHVAEWQNRILGTAFPQSTQLLLALALAVPGLIALLYSGQREGPAVDFTSEAQDAHKIAQAQAQIAAATTRLYVILAIAGLSALVAVGALALTLTLPAFGKTAGQQINLARSGAKLASGPAVVSGVRPASGELRYSSVQYGAKSVVRYLPVVASAAPAGAKPWLVIQLADDGLTFNAANLPARFEGVLAVDGLPKGLEASLKDKGLLGVGADGHYLVLFTQAKDLYRPYWAVAREFLMLALVFSLLRACSSGNCDK
jgi:hypothetical protein